MAQVGFFSFVFVDDLFNVLLKTYTNKLLLSTRSIIPGTPGAVQ